MGWISLQHAINSGSSTAPTVSLGSAVTLDNRVIYRAVVGSGMTISSLADGLGNTYTKVLSLVDGVSYENSIWDALVTNAGTPTLTATLSSGTASFVVTVQEYSGLTLGTTPIYVDGQASATYTNNLPTSGQTQPIPQYDGELAIGWCGYGSGASGSTFTPGTGWTQVDRASPGSVGGVAFDATTTQDTAIAANGQWSSTAYVGAALCVVYPLVSSAAKGKIVSSSNQ